MQKIKILFTLGSYDIGGKERQMTEIIAHLPEEGYECHLFFKNNNGYYFDIIKSKQASYLDLNQRHFNFRSFFKYRNYVKAIKPDVVFSFATTAAHIALLNNVFSLHRVKIINASVRDAPVKFDVILSTERLLYKLYTYIVANSEAGLKAYKIKKGRGKYILYNGLDIKRIPQKSKLELREALGLSEKKFIVTFVAKQDKRKDHITFIKSAKIVLTDYNDIVFFIIGEGELSVQNKDFAKANGVGEGLKFVGMLDKPEEYLKAADINVLCSASWHGEGIPNSVLEAFACGTPVIATNNGGTNEILKQGINGYLIPNADVEGLAQKIVYLYKNRETLKELSENAEQTFSESFTTEQMINNFESIINTVLDDK